MSNLPPPKIPLAGGRIPPAKFSFKENESQDESSAQRDFENELKVEKPQNNSPKPLPRTNESFKNSNYFKNVKNLTGKIFFQTEHLIQFLKATKLYPDISRLDSRRNKSRKLAIESGIIVFYIKCGPKSIGTRSGGDTTEIELGPDEKLSSAKYKKRIYNYDG